MRCAMPFSLSIIRIVSGPSSYTVSLFTKMFVPCIEQNLPPKQLRCGIPEPPILPLSRDRPPPPVPPSRLTRLGPLRPVARPARVKWGWHPGVHAARPPAGLDTFLLVYTALRDRKRMSNSDDYKCFI